MAYAITAIAALTLGLIIGLMVGVGSRHTCLDCGARLLRFCPPGSGCRLDRAIAVSETATALADAQLRDGRTRP